MKRNIAKIVSIVLVMITLLGILPIFTATAAGPNVVQIGKKAWDFAISKFPSGSLSTGNYHWYNRSAPNSWPGTDPIIGESIFLFCLDQELGSENGMGATAFTNPLQWFDNQTRYGIQIILENGLHNDVNGQPVKPSNLSWQQAYIATQFAMRYWLGRQGITNAMAESYYAQQSAVLGQEAAFNYAIQLYNMAITQANYPPNLIPTVSNMTFTESGGFFRATVNVNKQDCDSWAVTEHTLPAGSTYTPQSGTTNGTITISIPVSEANANKQYTITVTGTSSRGESNFMWYAPNDPANQRLAGYISRGNPQYEATSRGTTPESYGNLAIVKTTQHNAGTVSGFDFEVRNSSNVLIGTYTTTSTGVINIPNLRAGLYSVKEVNLSQDFVEPSQNPVSVQVISGQTATVSFDNIKKRGVLSVQKTNASPHNGDYSLAGAVFEVRDQGNTLVATITTGADGRAQTPTLPLGVYRLKETKAPYGFALDPNTHTGTISGYQGVGSIVYAPDVGIAEQPQVGRINIAKYNANKLLGDYNLAGAVFEIRNSGNVLVDTITTNAQGQAQSKALPLGDYSVSERTAPNGYRRNTSSYPVKLEYGAQTETVVYKSVNIPEEPQPGRIRIHKTNATPSMGDYDLSGAEFAIRAASTIKCLDGTIIYNAGDLVDTVTTSASGEAMSKQLPLGAYTVRETKAPTGFVLDTAQYNAVLSYAGQDTAIAYTDTTVPEAPQVGTITITKYDVATGAQAQGDATLAGAVFEVFCAQDIKKLNGDIIYRADQLVDTLYCGDTTSATTKELPLGSYYYREKVPPRGYILDTSRHDISIEYAGQNIAVNRKNAEVRNKVIEGQISLTKHTDLPDPSVNPSNPQIEQPLDGIRFEVFLKAAGSYAAALDTERDIMVTNENGYALSRKLPYGTYIIKELPDDQGRDIVLVAPFEVTISSEGAIYRYILNDPTFTSLVKIRKVDSETGKTIPAAGIPFKVKDVSTGQWVVQHINYPTPTDLEVFMTTSDGTLVMPERLKSGRYELYEQAAPWGYVLSRDPVSFEIRSTQTDPVILEVLMANAPQKGTISVEKKGNMLTDVQLIETEYGQQHLPVFSAAGLTGAVFEIRAAEDITTPDGTLRATKGTVVDTITTNSSGYAESKQLYLGHYTIVETKAPLYFVLDTTPHDAFLEYVGQDVAVTSTQIGIGNARQQINIELQKLMEQPDDAPEDFSPYLDVIFALYADEDIMAVDGSVAIAKGALVALIDIDSTGKGSVRGELPFAKYVVKEVQTSSFYQLNPASYPITAEYAGGGTAVTTITVNSGEPISNKLLRGGLKVIKTFEGRSTPLEGVPFTIVGQTMVGTTVTFTCQTDTNGEIVLEDLLLGTYTITELECGLTAGYELTAPQTIVVAANMTAELTINNVLQRGSLKVIKTFEGRTTPIQGVPFTIVGTTLTGTDFSGTYYTDSNGEIYIEDLLVGTYTVTELASELTIGYELSAAETIEVAPGQIAEMEINNLLQRGDLKLVKTFEGRTVALEGIPFTIEGTSLAGMPYSQTHYTDAQGQISVEGLPIGTYTVRELACDLSEGYILSEDQFVEIAKDEIAELTLENKLQRGNLKILKRFEGKDTSHAGVPFLVEGTSTAGMIISETHYTDVDGLILVEGLPVGTYTIRELASDVTKGFVLSDEYEVTVTADEIAELEILNKLQKGSLKIVKTFEGRETPITNVPFKITGTTAAGERYEILLYTNEFGVIEIDEMPAGSYTVTELGIPLTDRYILSEPQTIVVAHEELTVLEIHNILRRGSLRILKSSDDGKLEGFTFRVEGENYSQTFVTDAQGEIFIDSLPVGQYVVTEEQTDAARGYILPSAVTIEIIEHETLEVRMHNKTPDQPPNTGDANHTILYLLMMISAGGAIFLTRRRLKKGT